MASKRNSDTDPYDGQIEGGYPSDLATDVAEVAVIALETEAETDRMRHQMRQQQDQIESLFRLVDRQRSSGSGQNGNPPKDTPAVRRFRERMKVLKLAYPNTRI